MARDGWMDGVEDFEAQGNLEVQCSAWCGVVFNTPSPPTQFRLSKAPTNLRCAKGPRRKVRRTKSTPTILRKSTKEGIRLSSSSTPALSTFLAKNRCPAPRCVTSHRQRSGANGLQSSCAAVHWPRKHYLIRRAVARRTFRKITYSIWQEVSRCGLQRDCGWWGNRRKFRDERWAGECGFARAG